MLNEKEVQRFLSQRFPKLQNACSLSVKSSDSAWTKKEIERLLFLQKVKADGNGLHCPCNGCRHRRTAALWFHVIGAYFRAGECAENVATAYNYMLPGAVREYTHEGERVEALDVTEQRDPDAHVITPAMVRRVAQEIRRAAAGERLDGEPRSNGKRGRKPRTLRPDTVTFVHSTTT
jgi:hypothetical protein